MKPLSRGGSGPDSRYGHPATLEKIAAGEVEVPEDAEIVEADPLLEGAPNPGFLVAQSPAPASDEPASAKKSRGVFRAKPGPSSPAAKRIAGKRNAIVAKALSSGPSPVEVMARNMVWALFKAEEKERLAAGIETSELLDDIIRLREMADASAYRLAPYLHPKMVPIVPKGEKGLVVNFIVEDA